MIRRPSPFFTSLLGVGLAVASLAGCGGNAATPTPAATPTARPTATATPAETSTAEPTASGTVAPSGLPSPSPTQDLGLPHVNAALEDELPDIIGGIQLEKFSMPLSTYIASSNGGDKVLYTPWLVKFGKTPDDVDLAVAVDLTQTENFFVEAIQVPGISQTALSDGFASVARGKGWPVAAKSVGPYSVTEIDDTATDAAGGLGTAYVFAKGDVLFIIVTDDPSLLLEALIKLP
ncbi:MAG: hypothetical protein ABSA21_12840 [Candidatus Limnocylindrales bacterium]|jgi:hypothetical protein